MTREEHSAITFTPLDPFHVPQAVALWLTTSLTRPWDDPTTDALRALPFTLQHHSRRLRPQ